MAPAAIVEDDPEGVAIKRAQVGDGRGVDLGLLFVEQRTGEMMVICIPSSRLARPRRSSAKPLRGRNFCGAPEAPLARYR